MRKQATVQICTTWTPSKRGLNHSLEQVKQALTQRGYQHTSVCAATDGVAAGVLLDLLEGLRAVFPVRSLRMAVENPDGATRFEKTAPATRVCVGGTHEQI